MPEAHESTIIHESVTDDAFAKPLRREEGSSGRTVQASVRKQPEKREVGSAQWRLIHRQTPTQTHTHHNP